MGVALGAVGSLGRVRLAVFAVAAALLSGCAGEIAGQNVSLNEATFFSDPAKFAMYDCKQLAPVRVSYARRVEELKGLMNKAETGPGGAVIAELAYRPDYLSAQAALKRADEEWQRNRCEVSTDAGLARPAPGSQPVAGRSKAGVY
jgi:hypothetical protein